MYNASWTLYLTDVMLFLCTVIFHPYSSYQLNLPDPTFQLDNLPANVSSSSYSTAFPPNGSAFSLVPNNQFGVGEETLPATNESYIAESVKGLTDGSWRDALLSVVSRPPSAALFFCSRSALPICVALLAYCRS
jgi:hypothetical protein